MGQKIILGTVRQLLLFEALLVWYKIYGEKETVLEKPFIDETNHEDK